MMAPKQQPKKAAPPKAAQSQKRPPTPAKEAAKVTETVQQIATQTSKKGDTGSGDSTGLNTTQPTTNIKPTRILDLPRNVGNKVAVPVVKPMDMPRNVGNQVAVPVVKPMDMPRNVGNQVAQPAVKPMDMPRNVGNQVAQPAVKPLNLPTNRGGKGPVKPGVPAQQMVAPSSGKNVGGIKTTTAAAVKVAGAKGAATVAPVGAAQAAATEAATATPASAKDNPAFAALTSNIAEKATAQKRHESAGSASRKGQAAAKAPAGEQLQTAQANQAEAMDQAEAKSFNTESFKAMLKDRISQMKMPKNEEEADDFDKHTNVGEINQQAVGDVTAVKGDAVGEVASTSNAKPDTGSVPARKVAPMPKAKSGAKPAIGNVAKAMPPKRSAAEIEQPMAKEANKPDQALQDAGVSDHVLATSNEPSFTKALSAKETTKTQSQQATEDLRASEAAKQQQTQADAQAATNAQLAGMHGARVSGLNAVAGQQKAGAKANSAERKAVIDKVNSIFTSTQTAVNTALDGLDTEVTKLFDAGAKEAKQVFEDYTEKEMQAYKDKRYGDAWYDLRNIRRIGDAVTGLPKEVNNIYVLGRDEYIKALDSHITTIAEKVTAALTEAQNAIASGKQELKEYVDGLGPDLKALGQESASNIQSKFDSLEQDIADKQDSLIDSLADKYNSSVAEIDEDIAQRKEANKGLVGKAMSAIQGVIEFYNKIKALFDSLLTNVAAAGAAIMADPIGFAKNLFSGVGQGISNFMNNIGQHLQTGLIGWLTGASASLGITMPDNLFSAKGIFSLVTQVLGLSWNAVRGIGAQVIGERTMGILEKGFNLVMILKNEGITGLWEHLKESFINLKDQVIGQIKEMVITTVINAGMKWLLSLMNPAGALVKIVMGIVKVVQFIIERAASILELVDAFVQSIGAIAKGDVGAVAKNIEEALKRGIPLLIGMLANFLGLGSIARKVSKMLKKLRKPIVKGIKKLWMKLKNMGRKFIQKLKKRFKKKGKKPKKDELTDGDVGEMVHFNAERENHELWFEEEGPGVELWVASNDPSTVIDRLDEWKKQSEKMSGTEAGTKRQIIGDVEKEVIALELEGETLEDLTKVEVTSPKHQEVNDDQSKAKQKKRETLNKRIVNGQISLSKKLIDLFNFFEGGKKVSGWLLTEKGVEGHTSKDLTITEPRGDTKLKGYRAIDGESKEGYIVGQSENGYVKERKKKGDSREEKKVLDNMVSFSERRDHIDGGGMEITPEEQIENYNLVLRASRGNKKLIDWKADHPEADELTNKMVEDYRNYMRNTIVDEYERTDLIALDNEILHNSALTGTVSNKILGEIFEKWIAKHSNLVGKEIIFGDRDTTFFRKADGSHRDTILEMKSVASSPSAKHISQMRAYAKIIREDIVGYEAGKDYKKRINGKTFNQIRYYFSNEKAALKWEKKLLEIFVKQNNIDLEIYVGVDRLKDFKRSNNKNSNQIV